MVPGTFLLNDFMPKYIAIKNKSILSKILSKYPRYFVNLKKLGICYPCPPQLPTSALDTIYYQKPVSNHP